MKFAPAGTALTPTTDPLAALPRRGSARARETRAMLFSLLVHALLLSLLVGGQGEGWPGLAFPWQDRRAEVPELRVVLKPAPQPAPMPDPEQPATDEAPPPSAVSVAAPGATAVADAAPPLPAPPDLIAMDRPADTRWAVPPTPPASAPVLAAQPSASSSLTRVAPMDLSLRIDTRERPAEQARLDAARQEVQQKGEKLEAARIEAERQAAAREEAARVEAEKQEADRQAAARQEAARAEAERQEAAHRAAAQQEAARQEVARQEAAKAEAARQEAERQEAARRAAAQQEAARQELARQEAARQEAARAEAARQDAARTEAVREAAARQDAARAEAARLQAAKAAEEQQREARLRAIGQQLNEEAAKRDAAAAAAARQSQSSLPTSWSSARRGRLFGRADSNAELVTYAEAWARKIQLNPTFDLVRDALKQPYTDPLVTVAIRSDGSVESVTFFRSSGSPALDDAIRRVIQSQERYAPFPPALLQDYDVVEIRRTWRFDSAIRMY